MDQQLEEAKSSKRRVAGGGNVVSPDAFPALLLPVPSSQRVRRPATGQWVGSTWGSACAESGKAPMAKSASSFSELSCGGI